MKIEEPGYLFPITGGIITILGLVLPLGLSIDGTINKNFGSFFWILFHNIEINDLDINLLFKQMISLISILIVGCTAWTFKIINDATKYKIDEKKFERKMFELAIILSLLGINLILISGNAYLIEKFDNYISYHGILPSSMWYRYMPSFGFYCLIFGPIIIRFGTFYNTTDDNEKKKVVIIKTLIVLSLLSLFIGFRLIASLDSVLVYLTIFIILDCGIYLFLGKLNERFLH